MEGFFISDSKLDYVGGEPVSWQEATSKHCKTTPAISGARIDVRFKSNLARLRDSDGWFRLEYVVEPADSVRWEQVRTRATNIPRVKQVSQVSMGRRQPRGPSGT